MALDCGTGFSDAKDLMNPGLRAGGSSEEKTEEALESQGAVFGDGAVGSGAGACIRLPGLP